MFIVSSEQLKESGLFASPDDYPPLLGVFYIPHHRNFDVTPP